MPMLILGQTGTGKEIMARYIHSASKRKGNFIPVNCGAIPKDLIESELFGYESGSFTNAKKGGSTGLLVAADKGTLFLDEIGDLPMSTQVTLLRFLDSGEVRRVGADKTCQVDVQIVAATNVDLKQAKFLCSLPKVLGQHPDTGKDITLNSGRFGPYLKCENKSARLENVEDLFSIGINRAITLIAEAKPGRISSSLIKDLGEHPEDKKPVRIMKGQYGPYIKYKSLNATIPEEKDPNELTMEEALILIEKRKEYDKNKKKGKRK